MNNRVGIVMGSDSDWPVMKDAAEALEEFGVPFEADVVSAHRMAKEMIEYGERAAERGLAAIIAGAGGAAGFGRRTTIRARPGYAPLRRSTRPRGSMACRRTR